MARFHELTVIGVEKTIKDAVVVTLQPADGASLDFIQGQYLTFRRDFEGTEIRRSYSICVERGAPNLQVGIKKVDGGAFSTWANTELKVGETLQAMPPAGNFHTPISPEAIKTYLGFACGSGITPVLSIIKTTLAEEVHSQFTLVYANRGVNTIMFREELEDLKNRYMNRLNIIHVLEGDAQDIELFQGRVDAEKCNALFEHWINIEIVDTAFICGPEPMMLGIVSATLHLIPTRSIGTCNLYRRRYKRNQEHHKNDHNAGRRNAHHRDGQKHNRLRSRLRQCNGCALRL